MEHEVNHFMYFELENHCFFVFIDTITQKTERTDSIQFPEEVIVFTLESSDNECPGMLPEEKVNH